MTALKAGEIEAFLARPDPSFPIVLLYGPDAGSVSERAETLVRASVDDPNDPFALVRLSGEDLAADPARLVDEAMTQPLFGGRRAIWIRAGGRNIAGAVERLLAVGAGGAAVVIEAGDLKRNAPLRSLAERSRAVAAIPCYTDTERDLGRLVDGEVRKAGLTITADARAALLALLGGDRRASRSELEKLILYAGTDHAIDLEAVVAVSADASALALEAVIDAAWTGQLAEFESQFRKSMEAGTPPAVLVAAAIRHAAQLHRTRVAMDRGASTGDALGPTVFFRRKAAFEASLKAWTSPRLLDANSALAAAAFAIRRSPALGEAIAHRAMLGVALARRRA